MPNFGESGTGPVLRAGMVLAIEPMISMGSREIRTLADRWTLATADGSVSAHFEHTVALTGEGCAGADPRCARGRGLVTAESRLES